MPKKLFTRASLLVIAPLLSLFLAESFLRLARFGLPTAFLQAREIHGQPHWVNNPFFGYRFFSHDHARNPPLIRFPKKKSAQIVRILVLGESAALGDPLIEFSAPRILEKMLNQQTQDIRFEVINAAMTAINSAVIAEIAREMPKFNPDYVILYIGNNEAVGPFGPGSLTPSRHLTNLRIALTRLRLASIMRSLQQRWPTAQAHQQNFGMQLFEGNKMPASDPRLARMYNNYERNLRFIINAAHQNGAKVILSSVAVNKTEHPPWASMNNPTLTPEQAYQWHQWLQKANNATRAENHEKAILYFAKAEKIDHQHALATYQHAHALRALGKHQKAALKFSKARDLDALRFRADSRINQTIQQIAQDTTAQFIDTAEIFNAIDADSALFLDHVHFTFEGAHQLAHIWLQELKRHHPDLQSISLERARKKTLFTPWAARHQAMLMLARRSQPPFLNQPGNQNQKEKLKQTIQQCNHIIQNTPDIKEITLLYKNNIAQYPHDLYYHQQYGAILMMEGKPQKALAVLTTNLEEAPHHFEARILPAYLLARNNQIAEATTILHGEGPPYGRFLADHAHGIVQSLKADQLHHQAEMLKATLRRKR